MTRHLLTAALVAIALPAAAQTPTVYIPCGPFVGIAEYLTKRAHESIVSEGLTEDGNRMVVFASPDGESFSVVVVSPSGKSCVLVTGSGYEPGRLPLGGSDS